MARFWRFGLRTLLTLMFASAIFFAGYRLGVREGREAEFEALIDLVTSTITPDTWEDVGGSGTLPATQVVTTHCFAADPFESDTNSEGLMDPFGAAPITAPGSDPFAMPSAPPQGPAN